jgi:hypothetical protein
MAYTLHTTTAIYDPDVVTSNSFPVDYASLHTALHTGEISGQPHMRLDCPCVNGSLVNRSWTVTRIRVGLHSGNRSFVGPDADTCPGTNPQCDTKHCAKYLARIICKDVIVPNTVYSSPHQKLELACMQDVNKQRQKLHELSITVLSRAHRILTHL